MSRELTAAQEIWVDRVDRYLEGCEAVSAGPCPGCEECGVPEDAEEYSEDPHFSWRECEICHGIAGDRVSWHCIVDGEIVHGTCCQDCACYIANGDVPQNPE